MYFFVYVYERKRERENEILCMRRSVIKIEREEEMTERKRSKKNNEDTARG